MILDKLLTKIIGSKNERYLKRLQPTVDAINALESSVQPLSDDQLRGKLEEFRARLAGGEQLDDLLPEAFAVTREAAVRVLGMRHYDVQLIGGMTLNAGQIAEMKTGEGKTLMATLPVYLNAIADRGVHVVTVNDYLARRDAEWMGKLYNFLGLSVGVIQHDMDNDARREAYAADVTYGTNNEFGFDYLRDNMKFSLEQMVQRGHAFAIVDEVDSILIDEARTPLIISGPAEQSTDKYQMINKLIPRLEAGEVFQGGKDYEHESHGDYVVDEKAKTVSLTDAGVEKIQELLGIENLYDPKSVDLVHHVNQALKAHVLFKKDVDYMIKDGQVVIVDEFTGRLMPGRRWSDGLHQAVEAKEGVKIERENQTLATITFQNYFRMYDKLSGMTGTADTEAVEFDKIYELEVSIIPTNRDMVRKDQPDIIYRTEPEKWRAVAEEIKRAQDKDQPVLVGTVSIENSEKLSKLLTRKGVKHVVLNAKFHEMEAEIVAQAGQPGTVTIATNMAGRGTDIVLGGNPEFVARKALAERGIKPGKTDAETWERELAAELETAKASCKQAQQQVLEAGGLFILGTERHESRRIDNQLRGRAGRQGDPGESRFFLSLEDDLMRIFANDRIRSMMKTLGMEEDVPIESGMVSNAIERAQKKVEERNFEIRKHLLEYDDVNNKQRKEVYALRRQLLEGKEQREYVMERAQELLETMVSQHVQEKGSPEDWDLDGLRATLRQTMGLDLVERVDGPKLEDLPADGMADTLWPLLEARYADKEERIGVDVMRQFERHILLQIIDGAWKDHLLAMDHLKEGINLRAYGQRDPLVEYKRESFEMFSAMKERIESEIVRFLFLAEPMTEEERQRREAERRREQAEVFAAASRAKAGVTAKGGVTQVKRSEGKVGRNDPCPCGSGKKYKKCHGRGAA